MSEGRSNSTGHVASSGDVFTAGARVGSGRYLLRRTLGHGNIGVVWLAWDVRLEREVALRILPEQLLHDPNLIEKIKTETSALAQLDHPHIARTYDFVHDHRIAAISTEYVDGWSLAALRVDKPQHRYALEEITWWVRQVCAALDYAHNEVGILHLDLKPANLLLNAREQIKITDFGVACSLRGLTAQTDPHGLAETLGFLSPQEALGEEASLFDDVYGLGATIFDLLTGTPPFYKGQILAQICERPSPSLNERLRELEIKDSISPVVEDTVRRCLAKDPGDRPQTVSEVMELLERSELPAPVKPLPQPADEESIVKLPVTAAPQVQGAEPGESLPEDESRVVSEAMVQSEPYQEGTDNVSIPRQRPVWIAVGVCTLMALGCAVWFLVAHTMASKPVPRIALDTTFNPGTNAEREIRTAFVQPDKKILIGGTFTGFGDGSSRGLARLRADGSVDPVFAVTVTGDVHALALQPDGKIIIAGGFGKVNGQSRRNIARLDADGTLDGGFSPDAAVNREIRAVAIQPDGKILVAGNFDAMSGRRQNRIARLNADGTRDTSFRIGAGAPAMVWSLALQPDGKIIATGDFATFNNKRFARLVRLNENGSLDSTFNPGSGADGAVLAVALQKDGKILLGGDFTHVNDVERNRIARLNPDGSADATFNPGAGPNTGVRCVSVQPDGRILMGGVFTSVQGIARNRLARLNPDGILDTSFDPGEGASDVIRWVTVEPDGKILIAGGFKKFAGADRALIARLSGDSK